jgi:hypothetical protein
MKLAIYSDLHCEFERIQNQLLLLIMHPERSIPIGYETSELSPAYASNLEQDIIEMKHYPALWVHGHSHNNVDYDIGNTRVLSNQRAYSPSHLNEELDEHLIVHL